MPLIIENEPLREPVLIEPQVIGTCRDCNETMFDNQAFTRFYGRARSLGELVCMDCAHDNYFTCDLCNELRSSGDCHDLFENNGRGCGSCADNLHRCESCDRFTDPDIMRDNQHCPDCYEEENTSSSYGDQSISGRRYKPSEQLTKGKAGQIVKGLRPFGIELEITYPLNKGRAISQELPQYVGITGDGSIQPKSDYNGVEIITPPANGTEAEAMILNITDVLKKYKCVVNKSCGFHLHLSCDDLDKMDAHSQFIGIQNIWMTYIAYEGVIMSFLPPTRRANEFCRPLSTDFHIKEIIEARNVSELETIWYRTKTNLDLNSAKAERKHRSRYRGINMHTLFAERHLEIRYHTGTIVAPKILEWANLHSRILDLCVNAYQRYDDAQTKRIMAEPDINEKTNQFFAWLGLSKESESYFRMRQENFASSAKKVTKALAERSNEILSAEAEQ